MHLLPDLDSAIPSLQVAPNKRAKEPASKILLGTLRPSEVGTADTDVAMLPSGPGDYTHRCRIFAREIGSTIVKEHAIRIDDEIKEMELDDLEGQIHAKYFKEPEQPAHPGRLHHWQHAEDNGLRAPMLQLNA